MQEVFTMKNQGVCVISFREDGLLLSVSRPKVLHQPVVWALPGGHIEAGESINQAAVREMMEETGLLIHENHLTFLGIQFVPSPTENGKDYEVAFVQYQPLWPQNTQVIPEVNLEYTWIDWDSFCASKGFENGKKSLKNIEHLVVFNKYAQLNRKNKDNNESTSNNTNG